MKFNRLLVCLAPIWLLVSSVLIPSVRAAKDPVVTWNQANPAMPQLLPSTKYATSSIASTNSTGKKIWSVSGSCTLQNGKVTTKAAGFCKIKLVVQAKGTFGAKSFSKSMKIIPSPPPATTTTTTVTTTPATTTTTTVVPVLYKQSMPWGELSATQIASPKSGVCVDVPITLDVRSLSYSGIQVIEMKDDYSNLVGEIRPIVIYGLQNLVIHICRESWVYTYPGGVTATRAATLYCGLTIGFWSTYLTIKYLWSDSVCKKSSDRL